MSAGAPDPLVLPVQVPEGAATLALLERIAAAVEDTGKKSEEASEKTATGWERAQEKLTAAANMFNETREAVGGFAEMVNAAAEHLLASASNAERMERAQNQLGLSFTQAADAAGGYVNQVEVATAATSLAERGIRLHQDELNGLTRVAQNYARATGKEFAEAMEMVTEVVTEGGEEMGKLDTALLRVADTAQFTANDRLRALVERSQQIAPAARSAAEEMRAFQGAMEEADRAFATGFVESMASFRQGTGDAATKMRELRDEMHAAGATVSEVVTRAGRGTTILVGGLITGIGSVVGLLRAAGAGMAALVERRSVGQAAEQEFRAAMTQGFVGDVARLVGAQIDRLEEMDNDRTSMAAPPAGGPSAADRARDRAARGADMTFTLEETQGGTRRGGAAPRTDDHPDGITIGAAASAILDRLIAEARTRQTEQRAADAARVQGEAPGRANAAQERDRREAQVRAEGDALVAREREEQDRVKTREREQDDQAKRLENLQRFTEQWRQLHSEQVNVAASAAQSLNATFESLGSAMGAHFYALVDGQETLGQALQGILSDTLDALAKEAYAKGGFYFAEGLARLVMYDFPGAATSFGASVAYFAAGAGAQTLGAAVAAPAQPSAGGGSAGAGRGAESFGRPANDTASISGPTIVQHFYAPILGGRDALDSEVGQRMGRYTDAASQRQVRDRGGAPRRAA